MMMDEAYLQRLLTRALESVTLASEYGVILEGSLAEGFGNESSDVDFLVVTADDESLPAMPTVMFIDGHRVEVRFRSRDTVRANAEAFGTTATASARRLDRLSEETLDVHQRFAHGLPLRNRAFIEPLQQLYDRRVMAALLAAWHTHGARRAGGYASMLLHLRQLREATAWARGALLAAAKSHVAGRGETYVPAKWLSLQLARAGVADHLVNDFWRLYSGPPGADTAAFVRTCFDLVDRLGAGRCDTSADTIVLKRRASVTSWEIGNRVYVLKGRRDIFALGPNAGTVWQSLVFDLPVPELLADIDGREEEVLPLLATFHRLGFIGLGRRDTGPSWLRDDGRAPSLADGPIVSTAAAPGAACEADIALIPLPATRFAAAGGELVWALLLMENAREDALGARQRGQWKVFEASVRAMIVAVSRALLSAYGVNPLPPPEEMITRLADIPGVDGATVATAAALEHVTIDSEADAVGAAAAVDAFLVTTRRMLKEETFPSCFDSAKEWRRTLEIGYEWARLVAYLGVPFPVEDARDLLASSGRRRPERVAVRATSRRR